jgi:hypothetical protein
LVVDEEKVQTCAAQVFILYLKNTLARDHDPQVNDPEVVAAEHHSHNVLSDVVHIALHRCQ